LEAEPPSLYDYTPMVALRAVGGRQRCVMVHMLLVTALAVALLPGSAIAQEEPSDSLAAKQKNPYGSGAGIEVILTNSGFGLGGYYSLALTSTTSLMAEITLAPGKDEREFKFSSYFRSSIPNKANYLLMMPVQVGLMRRLFQDQIEDNFRPFLQLTGGPTLGWEYPYFRDCDGNGIFDPDTQVDGCEERSYDAITAIPRGAFRLGWGGIAAVGAHFGRGRRLSQGVRLGYAFTYFTRPIQLLEPGISGGSQRFFGTPTISVTFGRLF